MTKLKWSLVKKKKEGLATLKMKLHMLGTGIVYSVVREGLPAEVTFEL